MKKKNKIKYVTDIVCAAVVIVLFGGIAVFNLFQTDRPTVSESEKRTLTAMPEFSWESLTDGSFFSGVALHISDTFIARDRLVEASKKLETLTGVSYSLGGDNEEFVLLRPAGENTPTGEDEELTSKLSEALDTLNKQVQGDDQTQNDEQGQDTEHGQDTEQGQNGEQGQNNETGTEDHGDGENDEGNDGDAGNVPVEKSEVLPDGSIREIIAGGGNAEVSDLSLSHTESELTVGSGAALDASVECNGGTAVVWTVSDKNVVEISLKDNGGINVKALAAGSAVVTAKSGGCTAVCNVTVKSENVPTQNPDAGAADFLANGLFIYGDAVYTPSGYSPTVAKNYADTALYYKNLFGEGVTMSLVVAPVSSMVIDNPKITSQIPNQQSALANMAALCDPSVNFVDTYSEMYAHKDEYLFFKTDHHWTQRGAYYAYVAFAKSVGLTPTPLDEFDYELKNEYYQGSMYMYTQNARVKYMYDSVEAFTSRKQHTMDVTTSYGTVNSYDSSVLSYNKTYIAFIAGDNPYTHINVPENPQDKNVLVLKDSFGNAFVPFLCEHFGNIYVVDTRYSTFNIYDKFKDAGITDIIFANNIQAANSATWPRMYLSAVGVY